MAESVTVKFRPAYLEDLALTTDPDGETDTADIMGVGTGITVNKIAAVLYTAFGQYANDAAAAAAGIAVGGQYWNTTTNWLHTRMA